MILTKEGCEVILEHKKLFGVLDIAGQEDQI